MRVARGLLSVRGAIAVAVLVVAVAVGAVVLIVRDHSRLDEVRDTLGFSGCDRSRPAKNPDLDAWNAAVETETDVCGHLGSGLTYARFSSDRALRSTLLEHPPSSAVCLVEPHQVLLIDLIGGANADACHRVQGVVVARTEHVAPATGRSIDATTRSEHRFERQAAVAEGHALRRYWADHPVR